MFKVGKKRKEENQKDGRIRKNVYRLDPKNERKDLKS